MAILLLVDSRAAHAFPENQDGRRDDGLLARWSFDAEAEGVTLPVAVDDRKTLFEIATSSNVTTLDSSLCTKLGAPQHLERVDAADGEISIEFYRAPKITVVAPALCFTGKEVCTFDFARLRRVSGNPIYGMVGTDFFRKHVVRLDFDHGIGAVFKSVPPDSGTPIRLTYAADHPPTIVIWLAGAGEQSFTVAVENTGTEAGNIQAKLFDRLVRSTAAVEVRGGATETARGVNRYRSARVREISVADFRHAALSFARGSHNTLGLGYLSRYIVTFDFPGKMLYLKPALRFAAPGISALSGAGFTRAGSTTAVELVESESPSQSAGLMVGDVLERIDARPAKSLTMLQIRKTLCTAGVHRLEVTRGNQHLMIQVSLTEPVLPWPANHAARQPAESRSKVMSPHE